MKTVLYMSLFSPNSEMSLDCELSSLCEFYNCLDENSIDSEPY